MYIWSGQVVIPDGQKTNRIQFQCFKCLILLKSPNGAFLSRKWHDHCNALLQVGKSAWLSFLFWAKSWCGAAAWSPGILKGGTPAGCLEARLACPRRGCSSQSCTDGGESAAPPVVTSVQSASLDARLSEFKLPAQTAWTLYMRGGGSLQGTQQGGFPKWSKALEKNKST